jgi:hypothetical protein
MRDEGHVYTIVPYCSSSCQKILGVVISATKITVVATLSTLLK